MNNQLVAHTNSYRSYGFDQALAGIVESGYTSVDIKEKLGNLGLSAVALSGHSDLTTDEGLERGIRGVEWAAAHGFGDFTTWVGGRGAEGGDIDPFLDRIGPLAAAEASGVMIALEIHGQVMGSGELARPLIETINSDSVRVKYDTGNCELYGGVKAVDDIHNVADLLVNVDAKDKLGGQGEWHFPAPGEGHIDWPRLIALLDDFEYVGPLTVEIEFDGEPFPPIEEVTRAMGAARQFLTSLTS